jgi:hypothetical protein
VRRRQAPSRVDVPPPGYIAVSPAPRSGRQDAYQLIRDGWRHDRHRDRRALSGPRRPLRCRRFVDELLDDPDVVPFAAELRFALPLPGRRVGVLHFETPSLRGFEQLESAFDTIAGTARVA